MIPILQVALGGAVGAVLRYLSVTQAAVWFGTAFPFGTMFVNIAGSFLMGLAAHLLLRDGAVLSTSPLIIAGVLGGFTTFSAFSLDAIGLYENGQVGGAVLYVVGSVLLSLLALVLGLWLARGLT
ncbi:fluoride efflux transporter CrcB [Halovulum sp. GXIMD14793]